VSPGRDDVVKSHGSGPRDRHRQKNNEAVLRRRAKIESKAARRERLAQPVEQPETRLGFKKVALSGRNYPTPEEAVAKLRFLLLRDGHMIPDEDIWPVEDTPGAICPWTAKAWLPLGGQPG
jgi:hypothetical protein